MDLGVESFRMRDVKSGRLVPLEIRDGVLIANPQPQRPTAVELTFPLGHAVFGKKEHTAKFTVGLPVPLELRKAELVVVERGVKYPGSQRNEAGFVRVQFYSPDANGNAAHLLEHEVSVDGHKGRFKSNEHIIDVYSYCHPQPELDAWGMDTCGKLTHAPPGWHTITVTSHVLGEAKQPDPVSLRVNVQCDAAAGADVPVVDGEGSGGTQTTPASTAASATRPQPPAATTSNVLTAGARGSGMMGCAVAPRLVTVHASSKVPWSLLGVALLMARRKRAFAAFIHAWGRGETRRESANPGSRDRDAGRVFELG